MKSIVVSRNQLDLRQKSLQAISKQKNQETSENSEKKLFLN